MLDWDFYIAKLDGTGTLQWSKAIGGPGEETAFSIIQTTDRRYTAAGFAGSFRAGLDELKPGLLIIQYYSLFYVFPVPVSLYFAHIKIHDVPV